MEVGEKMKEGREGGFEGGEEGEREGGEGGAEERKGGGEGRKMLCRGPRTDG